MRDPLRSIGASSARAAGLVALLAGPLACSPEPTFGASGQGGTGSAGETVAASTGAGNGPGSGGPGSGGSGSGGSDAGSGASGGGSTVMAGSSVTSTSSAVTTGSGADCQISDDCFDADPCTDDACDGGACANTQKAAGQAGNPGEGSCDGVCQLDGACGHRVFSIPFDSIGPDVDWQVTTLSEAWGTGPEAPPRTGIVAVEHSQAHQALFVFTSLGRLHIRDYEGTWYPSIPVSGFFPGLPLAVTGTYSIQFDETSPDTEFTIVTATEGSDDQLAYIYTVDGQFSAEPSAGNPYVVDRSMEAGDAPPNATRIRWSFAVQPAFPPTPSWVVMWEQSDGEIYSLDGGSLVWTSHGPAESSPLWAAGGEAPPADGVTAAWYEDGIAYLVAP